MSARHKENTHKFLRKKIAIYINAITGLTLAAGGLGISSSVYAETTEQSDLLVEIVVVGQRASIKSAQQLKQDSNQIVDAIVADDIGKLPDRSVTEALQRVPGVTIDHFMSINDPEHFSAEGSGVSVRGLSQVKSTLNGRDTISATNGRAIGFEDVPAELMAAVEVYKNPSADVIEGGLGGAINLKTKMPFDTKGQKIAASVGVNYGDFSKDSNPSYSGLYSNNWETDAGKFGVLVDLAYSKLATRSDGIFTRAYFNRDDVISGETVYVPEGVDWRSMNFERERLGSYIAVQWKPSQNVETYATVFRSKYDVLWSESAAFIDSDAYSYDVSSDATYDKGALVSGRLSKVGGIGFGSDVRAADKESITTDYSAGVKWTPGDNWEITSDVQHISATSEGLDSTVTLGINLAYIDVDLRGKYPKISADNAYLANPENYYWAFTSPNVDNNEADQTSWRTDFTYSFDSSFVKSIKAGVRLTDKNVTNEQSGFRDWQAIYQNWMLGWKLSSIPTLSGNDLSLVSQNGFSNFFGGKTQVPSSIYAPTRDVALNFPGSIDQLHADAAAHYAAGTDIYKPLAIDPEDINKQDENTSSLYFLSEFEFSDLSMPIDGNIGARLVKTDISTTGYLVYPTQALFTSSGVETNADHSYTNVLPSLNVRLKVNDEFFLRFAASETMARPDFDKLQGNTILFATPKPNVTNPSTANDYLLTGSAGNPLLDPTTANQFDVSAEWYFNEDGGMAHATYFEKDISDFVRNVGVATEYQSNTYIVRTAKNVGSANIKGIELGWSQFFDKLPAPFNGLGFQANYTHLNSSTDVPNETEALDTNGKTYSNLPYEGISENAYNLIGIYEKNAWSFRLAYNWRSEYLMSVGPNGWRNNDVGSDNNVLWQLPVYADNYGQLDGSISYKIADQITLALEANNIANSKTKLIMKQTDAGDHVASYFMNDIRYALTLRGNF